MALTNWRERALPALPKQLRWSLAAWGRHLARFDVVLVDLEQPEWSLSTRSGWARIASAVRAGWSDVAPLWVGGLIVLCLLTGHLVFHETLRLNPKIYDWAEYMVLCTVFPALIAGVWLRARKPQLGLTIARAARELLVLLLLLTVGVLVVTGGEPLVLPLALAQVFFMAGLTRQDRNRLQPPQLAAGVVAVVAWTLAAPLLWWVPLHQALHASPAALFSFMILLVLVCAYVTRAGRAGVGRLRALSTLAALVLIALFSLRTDQLFDAWHEGGGLYHWGFYVGPAELVRQGGWLLWDVPSAYGFLSVLVLAAVPVGTAWQTFYLLNALLIFLVGTALFLLLSKVCPGPIGWVVALITTLGALFFTPFPFPSVPYWSEPLFGTHVLPGPGPYRFVWCVVLLGMLLWELRTTPGSHAQRNILLGGCAVWLLGMLWSAEVAVYCSAIWLPAFGLIVLRDWGDLTAGGWRSAAELRRVGAWLAVPPLLLAGAIGVIVAYYMVRLGHPPDPQAYVDYVISFGQGYVWQDDTVEQRGPVLGMLLLIGLVTGALAAALRGVVPPRMLPLLTGGWWGLWATGSYFVVQRGHPHVVLRAAPFACATVALLLLLAARQPWPGGWAFVVRMTAVPLLVMFPLAFAVLGFAADDPEAAAAVVAGPEAVLRGGGNVDQLLPNVDPALQELLTKAEVQSDDAIIHGIFWGNVMPVWTANDQGAERRVVSSRTWLPTSPFNLTHSIPDERKVVYTTRFIDRMQLGGWFIQRKEGGRIVDAFTTTDGTGFGPGPWLYELLPRTHMPTRIYENAEWQLVWFDYVGEDSNVVRPTYPDSGLEALPADILVDGRPLSQEANPELWALHGKGWRPAEPNARQRLMESPASLWIYSPRARQVDLRLSSLSNEEGRLLIAANGEAARQIKRRQDGGVLNASIGLRTGWNEVTLTLAVEDATSLRDNFSRLDPATERHKRDVNDELVTTNSSPAEAAVAPTSPHPVGSVSASPAGIPIKRIEIVT